MAGEMLMLCMFFLLVGGAQRGESCNHTYTGEPGVWHEIPGNSGHVCCRPTLCAKGTQPVLCNRSSAETSCVHCPEGHYSDMPLRSTLGRRCQLKRCSKVGRVVSESNLADLTASPLCACDVAKGYYHPFLKEDESNFYEDKDCALKFCPKGEQLTKFGDCERCPLGTFKNESSYYPCKKATDCLRLGCTVQERYTNEQDSRCDCVNATLPLTDPTPTRTFTGVGVKDPVIPDHTFEPKAGYVKSADQKTYLPYILVSVAAVVAVVAVVVTIAVIAFVCKSKEKTKCFSGGQEKKNGSKQKLDGGGGSESDSSSLTNGCRDGAHYSIREATEDDESPCQSLLRRDPQENAWEEYGGKQEVTSPSHVITGLTSSSHGTEIPEVVVDPQSRPGAEDGGLELGEQMEGGREGAGEAPQPLRSLAPLLQQQSSTESGFASGGNFCQSVQSGSYRGEPIGGENKAQVSNPPTYEASGGGHLPQSGPSSMNNSIPLESISNGTLHVHINTSFTVNCQHPGGGDFGHSSPDHAPPPPYTDTVHRGAPGSHRAAATASGASRGGDRELAANDYVHEDETSLSKTAVQPASLSLCPRLSSNASVLSSGPEAMGNMPYSHTASPPNAIRHATPPKVVQSTTPHAPSTSNAARGLGGEMPVRGGAQSKGAADKGMDLDTDIPFSERYIPGATQSELDSLEDEATSVKTMLPMTVVSQDKGQTVYSGRDL